MQKKFFLILVQTALTVGLFWTILKKNLSPHYCSLLYCTINNIWSIVKNFFSKCFYIFKGLEFQIIKIVGISVNVG